MKWINVLDICWWRYLFGGFGGPRNLTCRDTWTRVFCRARGHAGPIFYNASGWEPNMDCKHCGENLG
jgi:hypothetical protein